MREHCQLLNNCNLKLEGLLDNKGMDVSSVKRLEQHDYDYILVAVASKELFENIRENLPKYTVGDKVIWKLPHKLF